MNNLLNVSSSPHARSGVLTKNLMWDVVIAMIPASVFGVYQFGIKALLILLVTVASCVLSEYTFECLTGRDSVMDPGIRWYVCHHYRKTVIRWSGTELHEPGSGSKMFLTDLLRKPDVQFHLRWRVHSDSIKRVKEGR